MYKLTSLTYCV